MTLGDRALEMTTLLGQVYVDGMQLEREYVIDLLKKLKDDGKREGVNEALAICHNKLLNKIEAILLARNILVHKLIGELLNKGLDSKSGKTVEDILGKIKP